MRAEIASCSNTGLVREHNEDYIASDELHGIMVLADGMGGYQAGEVASKIAVTTMMDELVTALKNLPPAKQEIANGYHRATILLEQAVLKANRAIYEAAEQKVTYRGMGTTVVAAVFRSGLISIAHVGDSRLYRFRDGELEQLTKDHSVLQELIDCNFFTREQARHSPNRNLVTRALGVNESVTVDIKEYKILSQDIYLLCSDGLNDMLEDVEIKTVMNQYKNNLTQCAEQLVQAANEQGGEDNISVILARPRSAPLRSKKNWLQKLFGQ
jgi:protein phosphatase